MSSKAILIFNPASGRGPDKNEILPRLRERFRELDVEVEPRPTEGPDHATQIAGTASREDWDRVIAWGGDGTLNEVARGLIGTATPMGILPGGTVNVFARETGIPLAWSKAAEVVARGRLATIPVGMAGERPFLLMAGVGLDAEVVSTLSSAFKKAGGTLAFWISGFRELASYPMTELRVRWDEGEAAASGVIAGNIRRYAERYFITPEAKLEEPLLHAVMFQGRRRRDYLRYLGGVLLRQHLGFKDVLSIKTEKLTIESEGKVPFQLDGEACGFTPIELRAVDAALTVVLPEAG